MAMNIASVEVRTAAKEFVTFLNRAVTPYHGANFYFLPFVLQK